MILKITHYLYEYYNVLSLQDLEYKFQKENFKELSTDYIKWSSKLSDLESLMQAMLEQVNEKRIALNQQVSDTGKLVLKEKVEIKLNYIMYCSIKFYIAILLIN